MSQTAWLQASQTLPVRFRVTFWSLTSFIINQSVTPCQAFVSKRLLLALCQAPTKPICPRLQILSHIVTWISIICTCINPWICVIGVSRVPFYRENRNVDKLVHQPVAVSQIVHVIVIKGVFKPDLHIVQIWSGTVDEMAYTSFYQQPICPHYHTHPATYRSSDATKTSHLRHKSTWETAWLRGFWVL